MDTYLMTWNPDNWKWTELANDAAQTMKGVAVTEPWSCGNTKRIKTGDRLFLLKQGKLPRGIIASGRVTSDMYADKHWDEAKAAQGKEALYVGADWDTILDYQKEPLLQTSVVDDDKPPQVNWNTMSSGISVSVPVADRMEELWQSHIARVRGDGQQLAVLQSELEGQGYFDPEDLEDERERKLREVVQRRGQREFRNNLISAYNGRCAVTGCDAVDALEAAHITSYSGPKSHHVTNGLLLRADIHTLFDLNLIGIDPESLTVVVAEQLRRTCYDEMDGQELKLPDDDALAPSMEALQQRWTNFNKED